MEYFSVVMEGNMFRLSRNPAILLLIALLVAAACAPAATPGGTAPSGAAATGAAAPTSAGAAGTLVYDADNSDLISLDPAVAYEFSGVLLVHNVYETLVRFEGSDLSTIKPGLAQKWEITDAGDHWAVVFHLRSGAKFASGNPLTADDVVFSVQRVIKLNKSPAFLLTDIAGLKPESITATDPSTVSFSAVFIQTRGQRARSASRRPFQDAS